MSKAKRWGIRIALLLFAAGIALTLAWPYLPYQSAAARQIVRALEAYGLEVTSLTVESLDATQAVLTNIRLGNAHPLTVARLSAEYGVQDIRHGKMKRLALEGVALDVYKQNGKWVVGGLEPLSKTSASSDKKTTPLLALLPETLSISGESIHFAMPPYDTTSGPWRVTGALQEGAAQWKGTLDVPAITITGAPEDMPTLRFGGAFSVGGEAANASFTLLDEEKKFTAAAALNLPLDHPKNGKLTITRASYPWEGGRVSTAAVAVPLAMNVPVNIPLELKDIPLAVLLNKVSNGKVEATGYVSGVLPVVYHPDGTVTLEDGKANADSSGMLSVLPDAIPSGGRQEIEMVRAALLNFHYTSLKILVSSDAEKKSTIQLVVEGNNPAAFEGRPVKLTVNLTGDVLPMIQQSLLPLQDVRSLLRTQESQ